MKRYIALGLCLLLTLGIFSGCGSTQESETTANTTDSASQEMPKVKKVLTLGHSLAVDAGHMLALIADAEGYDELTIGTLYYSGCPLGKHVQFLQADAKEYSLYMSSTKTPNNPPTVLDNVSMKDALRHQDWDLIIMQGGVFEIGESSTYTNGNIQIIQNYVNENKLNPKAVFAWNMAWAPPVDNDLRDTFSSQPNGYYNNYVKYNDDRSLLYQSIAKCVSDHIVTDETFRFVIPSGTVLENALTSYLTEKDLHRDYVHASDLGRVMVSYVWYCRIAGIDQLTELKLDTVPTKLFRSTQFPLDWELTEAEKALILESVNNALKNPFEVTPSQYTTAPEA